MKNIADLTNSIFGKVDFASKSGSTYTEINGCQIRVSDHYVSKVGGGQSECGNIEIIGNWSMRNADGTRNFYGVSVSFNRPHNEVNIDKWNSAKEMASDLEDEFGFEELTIENAIELINIATYNR